ncbi:MULTISPECIES: chalcone isomerase family protein [sulfur-oxidizing symbionts]|jgi:hypothetical protein|uniref:Chalcone isomerase domain-containing protein n=1 Tax=endosymbiont of Riftia pachyptila (vent Ph05) TaxID=1048808 RepID=G2D8Z7_9GAMM|nr:hypothetical protein Rifp1Sym_aa00220 [endosymbiont of Riftia pachyptila (vent Ph05)]
MIRVLLIALSTLLLAPSLFAREITGVPLAETTTVAGKSLLLNGAGIRTKFFFKIYVGALYLPQKSTDPETIYPMSGPKRVSMHFLYDHLDREKLVDGWNKGFRKNLDSTELTTLQPRIDAFNAAFSGVDEGDEIHLDYIPGRGTEIWIRGQLKATIKGADFHIAWLKIWLGNEPADKGLKEGMLAR